jgi:hypothetical protein
MSKQCDKLPDEVSSSQLLKNPLQTPSKLPAISLTGVGGVRSTFMPFDVTFVESPTMLLAVTET